MSRHPQVKLSSNGSLFLYPCGRGRPSQWEFTVTDVGEPVGISWVLPPGLCNQAPFPSGMKAGKHPIAICLLLTWFSPCGSVSVFLCFPITILALLLKQQQRKWNIGLYGCQCCARQHLPCLLVGRHQMVVGLCVVLFPLLFEKL